MKDKDEGWSRIDGQTVNKLADELFTTNKSQAFVKVLDLIALQIRELIGAHQSAVSYIPNGDFERAMHTISFTDKYKKYRAYDVKPTGKGIWSLIFKTGKSMLFTEKQLKSHPKFLNFSNLKTKSGLEHPPMPGWLAVPIKNLNNTIIGVLQLSDKYEEEFTNNDLNIIEQYANLICASFDVQYKSQELKLKDKQIQVLDKLAHIDHLTQIPNRLYFDSYYKKAFLKAKRHNINLTIMLIDLDSFKAINDTFGHFIGDQILIELALRIKESIREHDFIARLGGDEFAVILEDLQSFENTENIAKKIIRAFLETFKIQEREIYCSVSIGINNISNAIQTSEKLLKNVDLALYRVKQTGRNNYLYYQESIDNKHKRKMSIESYLNLAIYHHEFTLLYQPIIDCKTNKISYFEALLRWEHPLLGNISPDEFIPIAESSQKISAITLWVFESVCQQITYWKKQHLELKAIAINISAIDICNYKIINKLISLSDQYQINPALVRFELIETSLMNNDKQALKNFKLLHNLGYKISIDDFGTGYSSLSRLSEYPIDTIKIDKSFISPTNYQQKNIRLIKSIIAMAKELGYKTVMEGVETNKQQEFIKKINCDFIQGYYFYKPLCVTKITTLLKSHKY